MGKQHSLMMFSKFLHTYTLLHFCITLRTEPKTLVPFTAQSTFKNLPLSNHTSILIRSVHCKQPTACPARDLASFLYYLTKLHEKNFEALNIRSKSTPK